MAFILISYTLDALVLFITATYFLYKYSIRNFDYWKKKGIPYPKPLPFIGNFSEIFMFRMTIGHYLSKLYNEFQAPYFGMYVLNKPHLVIRDVALIKSILVKDFNFFPDRTVVSDEKCDSLFSKMLFSVKNPEWKYMRTKVTPVFTSGKIKNMFGLIKEVAEEMKTYVDKNHKDSIETKELCAKYATDVISSCAFGINANSFQFEDAEFRKAGSTLFDFTWKVAMRQTSYFLAAGLVKLFRMPFFEPKTSEFLRSAFWATIDEREKTKSKRNDLIDIIIQIRNQSSPNDAIKFEGDRVVAQAGIFFVAGFETTSSTISFALYELCIHSKIQNKLREEIKTVVREYGGLTYEAIQDMKYLHMVICETLRKYPVLPFLDRMCMEDYKIPNSDFVIEKGTPVFIPMFGLHYDSKYFPNPDQFDPERFSDKNKTTFPPFSYIPFGEGPRNCIGERFGLLVSKLGIAQILLEYELETNSKTPIPLIYETKSIPLASAVGLPMKFKKVLSDAA